MNPTKETSLFSGFSAFEGLLPDFARTGLFSAAGQKYTREQSGRLDTEYRPSAVVLSRREETAETITLKLLPGERYPDFVPGQHIDVAVEIAGVRHVRQYSLTGIPGAGALEITVKRQKGGLVSNHLLDHAESGTRLEISVPRGEFLLRDQPTAAYCFFSAGSGITPVYAMARAVLQSGTKADVWFFHAAKSKDAVIFRHSLERLAFEYKNFKPYFFLKESDTNDTTHRSVRLNYAAAESMLPSDMNPHTTQIFVCGSGAFVQDLEGGFTAAGFSGLQSEYYTLPETAAGEGAARFLRSRATVKAGTNLLEAAEAAGIQAKHGCRRGICHECKAHKRSGTVKNILTGKETSGREDIQLCITQPVGVVEIDL
ncbi:MAG: 2Fe-2S iron-sulfur cluster binding domain-containing protein [Spirochaetes bacterium]|nr:2Fe-2S iron-sulfur cluster binding domain-containing protein [Spirochaetota bacterium]